MTTTPADAMYRARVELLDQPNHFAVDTHQGVIAIDRSPSGTTASSQHGDSISIPRFGLRTLKAGVSVDAGTGRLDLSVRNVGWRFTPPTRILRLTNSRIDWVLQGRGFFGAEIVDRSSNSVLYVDVIGRVQLSSRMTSAETTLAVACWTGGPLTAVSPIWGLTSP